MRAVVTKEFPGRPDNEPLSRPIAVGEVIGGDLACVAVANKWAEEADAGDPEPAPGESLDEMTLDQLKIYAADQSIDLGSASKKADVRAVIDAALKA